MIYFRHLQIYLIIISVAVFTGCASSSSSPPRYLHEVPVGTRLSLEQDLSFSDDSLRVYLQGGKVYASRAIIFNYGGASYYLPYCTLELRRKVTSATTLNPREYTIDSVVRDTTYQFFDKSEFRTQWRLSGGGEPEALYFTCYRLGRESSEPPISLQEVDHAVGGYFRLKLAPPAPQEPQK